MCFLKELLTVLFETLVIPMVIVLAIFYVFLKHYPDPCGLLAASMFSALALWLYWIYLDEVDR